MPAPVANTNALTHGMAAGALPPGCGHVVKATKALRTSLQNAVMAARGQVSITDAAAINTAIRFERLAMLAQRWLRLSCDTMSHDQRLAYAREVARASAERDKAIRSLKLDADADPMAALAAAFAIEPQQPAVLSADDAGPPFESPSTAEGSSGPENCAECYTESGTITDQS
jgi:hypothetical protein